MEYLIAYKQFLQALFLNVAAHIVVPIYNVCFRIIKYIDTSLNELDSKEIA